MADDLLSNDQFAAQIKAKYPQYANVENNDLVNRIVTKYPEYKERLSSFAPNAGLSGAAKPSVQMQEGPSSAIGATLNSAPARFAGGFLGRAGKLIFDPNGGGGQLDQPTPDMEQQYQQHANSGQSFFNLGDYLRGGAGRNIGNNLANNVQEGLKQINPVPVNRIKSGDLAGGIGETAANLGSFASLLRGGLKALPSTERAGQAFGEAARAANPVAIDLTAPGNTALRIQEMAGRGGMMPKVVRDFIRRTTDPNQPPLTYQEARDFYSNASRLSADEMQRLTPVQKRMIGQFTRDLGNSIQGAADSAGVGPQYSSAMREYRQASQIKGAVSDAGQYFAKQLVEKLPWLASAYAIRKVYDAAK